MQVGTHIAAQYVILTPGESRFTSSTIVLEEMAMASKLKLSLLTLSLVFIYYV